MNEIVGITMKYKLCGLHGHQWQNKHHVKIYSDGLTFDLYPNRCRRCGSLDGPEPDFDIIPHIYFELLT